MNKLLLKLLTLLELAVGSTLLILGVSGFFSYFLFNALLGIMGFVILADGLSKIDNPSQRENGNDQTPDNDDHHHHHGGGHRFGSGEPDSNED